MAVGAVWHDAPMTAQPLGGHTSSRNPRTRIAGTNMIALASNANPWRRRAVGLAASLAVVAGSLVVAPSAQAADPAGGEVDQAFVVGAGLTGTTVPVNSIQGDAMAVEPMPDGSVIVGGFFSAYKDQRFENLVRVRADGSADPAFRLDYNVSPPEFPAPYTSGDTRVVFGPVASVGITAVERVSNDRILVGGAFRDWSFLKMLDGTGRQVDAFRCQAPRRSATAWYYRTYCFNGAVRFIQSLGNNTFLIGGNFDTFSERKVSKIGRFKLINNVLTLDETFVSQIPTGNTGTEDPPKSITSVRAVGILSNGDYLLGGEFTKYGNRATPGLVHVTNTGELVNTFTSNAPNTTVRAIVVGYPNRETVTVGGDFSQLNGNNLSGLALMRMNAQRRWVIEDTMRATGAPGDPRKNFLLRLSNVCQEAPVSPSITSLALDSAGFLYVGGNFNLVQNNNQVYAIHRILRLDMDMKVDPRWAPGGVVDANSSGYFINACERNAGGGAWISALAPLPSGGLAVGGNFQAVFNYEAGQGGTAIDSVNLVRLRTNARVDGTVSTGTTLQANKPGLKDVKTLTPKANFTIEGTITGSLAAGETVSLRRLFIGTATFENGECQNLASYDVTASGIAPATARGMVTTRPGRYMCAIQEIATSAGSSRSGTAYYLVSAG